MLLDPRRDHQLLQFQRAVDLQGLGDSDRALVADLIGIQAVAWGKGAHGEMVERWSRDDQEMVKGVGSKGERLLQRFQRAVDPQGLGDRRGA